MSPRRRAQLLLPSPLGTIEYDVLEDSVFVGPASRGGLTADPVPFREAVVAITTDAEGYVIRALPGEPDPEINGAPGAGAVLSDGDEIVLGGQQAIFRSDTAKPKPPAAAAGAQTDGEGAPRRTSARRATPRLRPNPFVTAVALVGLLLLLFGVFLAVENLGQLRAGERVTVVIPEPPSLASRVASGAVAAQAAYEDAEAWGADNAGAFDKVVERFRSVAHRYPESPEADRARARIREIVDEAGRQALAKLDETCVAHAKEGRFTSALKAVRNYERTYGATSSAADVDAIRRRVRKEARASLDVLLATIGPTVASNPRSAHRQLLLVGPEYPPDLAAEITGLMELAIERMRTQGPPPPERRAPRRPGEVGPGEQPTEQPGQPRPPDDGRMPADEPERRERDATDAWREAWNSLKAGRYEEALEAYTLLSLRYGGTDVYREHRFSIANGRTAAKAGAQGPAGLLSVPVEEKRGRLEVEYVFDDARIFEKDFSTEQPFPSDRPVSVQVDRGAIRLREASGIFHALVWSSDVRVEARVVAQVAHDFGILAVAETESFRAVMLNINNTRFTLKKGAAAQANPGHLLWFMGQGVWAAADADAVGYIKIAERQKVSLENGDRVNLELIRNGDHCEGGFQGRTDGVSLKGSVKGDDGGSMGAARIGLFTNTGEILVESVKISGTVDKAWFAKYLTDLVELAGGPD